MDRYACAMAPRPGQMSDEHKAALAEGRAQGRAVRAYLEALEANKPRRGRKRTVATARARERCAPAGADVASREAGSLRLQSVSSSRHLPAGGSDQSAPGTCVDWQRTAGQGDAKAHSKIHRGAFGAPRRRRGRLGLWVLLRFRLALASRALQVHALFLFPEPPERKK